MGIIRDTAKIVGDFKRACPYCQKLISREATICPYCQKQVTPILKQQSKEPTDFEMKLGGVMAIIFSILLLAGFTYLMIKDFL